MRRPGSFCSVHAPFLLEGRARRVVGDVPIRSELVRERAHVARALHVVLAAQRIDADAFAAEVRGGHREIRDAHDHRRALRMLGDAETVVDRAVAAGRVEPRGSAHVGGRHAGHAFHRFGRIALLGDELAPLRERIAFAARADELLVDEILGDDDVSQRVDQRDVRAGLELEVIVGLDVRRAHEIDAARIGDDQLRALAQAALHLRGEHRMAIGRIRADDHDDVGLHDRIEILRAGRFAERVLESVAGRRMADARAGVDVVVAESGAHELLHEIGFLVRAARRGDAADRIAAVLLPGCA